jgi:hypothetical protein
VPGIPAGGVLDLRLCEMCSARLTVLEPATGRLRPLARQPNFGRTAGIRAVTVSGDVVWVLAGSGETGRDLLTAVSRDRGRSWRILPVPGTATAWESVQIFSDGGSGAYVLLGRDSDPRLVVEFTGLWRIRDPAGAWQRATPVDRPKSAAVVVPGAPGPLITTEDGDAWRLLADGTMRRLPRADHDGVLIGPGIVTTGPGGALLGLPRLLGDRMPPRPTVVVSIDEGETWRVEAVG